MGKRQRSERGQALIIIVFGMIALIGMTGLAIDGGNSYSDRRHAQNAADTAALATGLSLIRNSNPETGEWYTGAWDTAHTAGMTRAQENGYDDNLTTNWVNIYHCDQTEANCQLPPAEAYTDSNGNGIHDPSEPFTDTNGNGLYDINNPHDFVKVTIESHVSTYFAKVLGIAEMTNSVEALAKARPPMPIPWYGGNALISTMPGCKTPGWPNDPFTLSGGSLTVVTGSGGVLVNSTCKDQNKYAFTSSPGSEISSVSGICVVGDDDSRGTVNPPVDHDCVQTDAQMYQLPTVSKAVSCPDPGEIFSVGGGVYVATPGLYESTFPPSVPSGSTIKLTKGIYCLDNGVSLQGDTVTTDIDGNGVFDGSDGADEGALLYVMHGGVTFNGNSTVKIGAINKAGTDPGVKGYLFYVDKDNQSTVTLSGGSNSVFIGTILAPSSLVTIEGASDGTSLDLQCQVIGYSIKLTGSGGQGQGSLRISFSQSQVATTFTNPELKPFR